MRNILIHNHKTKKHQSSNESVSTFLEELHVLKIMANVGTITIDPDASRPANSATIIVGPYTIYILDVIDDEVEELRINKELEEIEKDISKKEELFKELYLKAPLTIVTHKHHKLIELKLKRRMLLKSRETLK